MLKKNKGIGKNQKEQLRKEKKLEILENQLTDKYFEEKFWWSFSNFKGPDELPLSIYNETFTNAKLKGEWRDVLHPVEYLFYHKFYKKLSSKGNCFGICLEALYAQKGRSSFSYIFKKGNPVKAIHNVNMLPEKLIREIQVKHGYQWGLNCIKWFVQLVKRGVLTHPSYLVKEVEHYLATGNHPIISMMKGLEDAHAVLAYRLEEMADGAKYRIYTADPNFIYMEGERSHEQYLEVDCDKETFTYWDGNKIIYQTDREKIFFLINIPKGCAFAIPYEILATKSQAPSFLSLLSVLWKAVFVFIGFRIKL